MFKIILEWFKKLFSSKNVETITEKPTEIENENNEENTNSEMEQENHNQIIEQEQENHEIIVEEQIDNENIQTPVPVKYVYNGTVILLDNGHASTTPGKRSPKFDDGYQFFEYEFNRDIVKRIAKGLEKLGVEYRILVPEVNDDISLTKRAERANTYCAQFGAGHCLFISIHANAAGNGGWMNARGWSVWTTKGNTKSDAIATIFFEEAQKTLPNFGMTLRKDMTDGDPDYEENFTVIYKTKCPAILTENLFMDNKTDVEFLRSDIGRQVIADIHINAIKQICFKIEN